jgi:glutamine synthetase adenylyltransferase
VTATVRTWDHSFACGIHADQPCTCKEDSPVSGATYRIDVEHRPDPTSTVQWIARVTRLSDDNQVTALWGQSAEAAVTAARAWLYAQNVKQSGRTLFVDDEGTEVAP